MSFLVRFVRKYVPLMAGVFQIAWLSLLSSTDAMFFIYAIFAFLSFFCLNKHADMLLDCRGKNKLIAVILSVIFSSLVLLANYPLFFEISNDGSMPYSTALIRNILNSSIAFVGGICIAFPLFLWCFQNLPFSIVLKRRSDKDKNFFIFSFASFFITAGVFLLYLFCAQYPGTLSEDSMSQIKEMISGQYSNFNSFWHTRFVQFFLSLGYNLFGEVNAAVCFYCAIQAVILAFSFTYCLNSLYLAGIPWKILILALISYAFLPYNIAFSITIWKDVLFGAGCLLLSSSIFRLCRKLSSRNTVNYLVFILGSILFSLSRNIGWCIYLALFISLVVFLRRDKQLLVIMAVLLLLFVILANPVLDMLNVAEGDFTENLSLPLQQVARVIADGCVLTDEETKLISQVVDIEDIPDIYIDWLSDPVKVAIRSKDFSYFKEHLAEYTKLWFRLGTRYPVHYVKAWVDQTKGYWNGGYEYFQYVETIAENPYGIAKADRSNILSKLYFLYFGFTRAVIFYEPLRSIGLYVWITILCTVINIIRKRSEYLLAVPCLIIVLGLWATTPVFASFRYVYPLFITLPLIVTTTIFQTEDDVSAHL